MAEDVWYVHHDGTRLGPLSWSELVDLAFQGGVDPVDLVWQPEWEDWRLADTVEGLLPVPKSDTEPVVETPADEVSAEALVDEVPAGEPAADEVAADEVAADEAAAGDTAAVEAVADETPAYGFPIDESPAGDGSDAEASEAGGAAEDASAREDDAPPAPRADVPATRLGPVVVSRTSERPVLQRPIEGVLGAVRRLFSAGTMDRIDRAAATAGQIAYLGAALLVTVLLLVVGIRNREVSVIVFSLAVLPAALCLGYSASRFLDVIARRVTTSQKASGFMGFLDGFAACAVGLGVLSAAVGVSITIAGAGAVPLLAGLCSTLVLFYAAGASLEQKPVAESPGREMTAGQEAVAVLSFVARIVLLRLAPVVFAASAVAVAMTALWMLVSEIREPVLMGFVAVWIGWRVLTVALLPMAAWFVFQLVSLVVGVAGSLVGADEEPTAGHEND